MNPALGRRDAVVLLALVLLGAGVPLALAAAAGALGVPSNDDWVYRLGADAVYRSGAITMPGHTATAAGQILLVQPLLWLSGGAPWAYPAFGLGMAALGIAAAYLLARSVVGPGAAAMAAILVIAFPGFARESASFMTDVPTFALEMVSLLLGTVWLRSGRTLGPGGLAWRRRAGGHHPRVRRRGAGGRPRRRVGSQPARGPTAGSSPSRD